MNVLMEIQRPATGTALSTDFLNSPNVTKKQFGGNFFNYKINFI